MMPLDEVIQALTINLCRLVDANKFADGGDRRVANMPLGKPPHGDRAAADLLCRGYEYLVTAEPRIK